MTKVQLTVQNDEHLIYIENIRSRLNYNRIVIQKLFLRQLFNMSTNVPSRTMGATTSEGGHGSFLKNRFVSSLNLRNKCKYVKQTYLKQNLCSN